MLAGLAWKIELPNVNFEFFNFKEALIFFLFNNKQCFNVNDESLVVVKR